MADRRDRERPWIHPEAVAALVKEGLVEPKDIPALIRLYVRAQIEWHRKADKDYWEGNEAIAKALGVPLYKVENAIRRSAVMSRNNGGKGRGADKRFTVTESAKPTESTSHIDGCHQSDRRVETVNLADATSQIDGCHRNRRKRNKDKVTQKEGREEEPTSLPVRDSSSFKSEEEFREVLTEYDLVDSRELPHAYYSLLTKCTGSPITASEKDIDFAARCLEALPENLRRPDVISAWLVWWCMARPRKRDKTWWFTSFSGSWSEFHQKAIAIAEAADEAERERREAERQRQREQEEAERRAKREAFVAGLPTGEDVAAALFEVPEPATFGYNYSVHWVKELAAATGLMLKIENSTYEYGYINSAYRKVDYDPDKMILETLRFFANIAVGVLKRLREDEDRLEIGPLKVRWESFCRHFGLEEWDARLCRHLIPEEALNYREQNDGDQPSESASPAKA